MKPFKEKASTSIRQPSQNFCSAGTKTFADRRLIGRSVLTLVTWVLLLSFINSASATPSFLRITSSSPQHQSMPFGVTVTVHAADGSLESTFSGPLTLTASGAIGPVSLLGGAGLTITNGSFTGLLTIPTNAMALTLHGET